MKWPQHDGSDLEIFLSRLQAEVKENQQIVGFKIENKRSTDMDIAIEPQGSGDTFPAGAIYEVVGIGKKENSGICIQIRENSVFVYWDDVNSAIFDKGAATLAY
jgi:hypothetical protein